MKEMHFFHVPQASTATELPADEAVHAARVLRLTTGDEVMLLDGCGTFYRAEVTTVNPRRCQYRIVETLPQQPAWTGHLHLAIAPTKMMERMEWLAEKATEIGFDELSLIDCRFSERHVVKTERIERIVAAAMKQSRKAWKPKVNGMVTLQQFIGQHASGHRYIAHCYDEVPRTSLFNELMKAPATASEETVVLIGPEGDFAIDEVRQAIAAGFTSVDLGRSRLRTETAGLAAVIMMQLSATQQQQKE
jgi:16S rRNA (uracil1498-N3)-methyltransferase